MLWNQAVRGLGPQIWNWLKTHPVPLVWMESPGLFWRISVLVKSLVPSHNDPGEYNILASQSCSEHHSVSFFIPSFILFLKTLSCTLIKGNMKGEKEGKLWLTWCHMIPVWNPSFEMLRFQRFLSARSAKSNYGWWRPGDNHSVKEMTLTHPHTF